MEGQFKVGLHLPSSSRETTTFYRCTWVCMCVCVFEPVNEFYALLVSLRVPVVSHKGRRDRCHAGLTLFISRKMWSGSSEGQSTDGHWRSFTATVTHHPLLLFLGCHGFWGMSLGKLKHIFGNNSLPGSNSLPLSLSIFVCLCVLCSQAGRVIILRLAIFKCSPELIPVADNNLVFFYCLSFHRHLHFTQMCMNTEWRIYIESSQAIRA